MKTLVFGAGPLGSLFAARLMQAGQDVTLLARRQRLADLRQYGVVLEDALTRERSTTHVPLVETLQPEDAYDLILVVMRKNKALEALPTLSANHASPNILFLMNNAAGPDALIQAVGRESVLVGFPSSAGSFVEGHVVRCLSGNAKRQRPIAFGEVDGQIRDRTRQVATLLASMPGYTAEIRSDMDAWLKTHVAFLFPAIAPAIYAGGMDRLRMARTRDLLVLVARGVREGFRVLKALHIPITPASMNIFTWPPEALVVSYLRKLLQNEVMDVALIGHASSAGDEMRHLAAEFDVLIRQSGVKTPVIDRLRAWFDPGTPPMPDGSRDIPLHWW